MDRRLPHCGCCIFVNNTPKFLPLVHLDARVSILSSTSRTTLTQTFVNPKDNEALKEARYVFPLYDGVSVVGFTCTIGSRVIQGVVKERQEAKREFDHAVSLGQTAGLLEQSEEASDVFSTTLGNIPAGQQAKVEITYLGELKHDAEFDGLRFTIPTCIAPRYGESSLTATSTINAHRPGAGISVTVDADMSQGSTIQKIHSPSHPISVNIGTTSTSTAAATAPFSLQRASATLSLASAELDKDFVIQIAATGLGDPAAILETHPSIPNQRALMATLVPRFNLAVQRPEVVFLCDRSGSMGLGQKIPNLIAALQIFLKSLPVGVKFNICSFGSDFSFLWERSQTYDQGSLDKAVSHVKSFAADYGGTEMYRPMEQTFARRYKDMNLEVFLLTDGEIWGPDELFRLIREETKKSNGAIRVFTLGVGRDVSHALIEGVARAGNGFAQTVSEDEKMDKKVVRMLKGALTPHVHDYTLEIKYDKEKEIGEDGDDDDDFELVEKVMDALTMNVAIDEEKESEEKDKEKEVEKKTISLFDQTVKDEDLEMSDATAIPEFRIPAIAEPRYLQTPIEVPALFPFNRTTVYILLSDFTPSQRPKSVVLRGTCDQGPLELEIPITTLAEAGTTIHQLAAKKAIGELEEGSGWIYRAKNDKGNLLKGGFESRFSDMVKREAVRLGVQYQIGGRWTSFVAVQDDNRGRDEDKKNPDTADEDVGRFEVEHVGQSVQNGIVMGPMGYAARAMPAMAMMMPMAASSHLAVQRSAAPSAFPFGVKAKQTARRSVGGAAPMMRFRKVSREVEECSFEASDADSIETASPPDTASSDADTSHPVSTLASLQTFSGSWTWSSQLESILGITKEKASSVTLPAQWLDHDAVLATLCVLMFLKDKLSQDKETWELLAEKAEDWLFARTGDSLDDLEKIVRPQLV